MRNLNPSLIAAILFAIFTCIFLGQQGCTGLQISQPNQEAIMEGLGYQAAYWPFKNNPDLIPMVSGPLNIALAAVDQEGVDVAHLIREIVIFGESIMTDKDIGQFAAPLKEALLVFEGTLKLDLNIPEKYDHAVRLTRAFLQGAQKAILNLKEV